MPLKPRKKIDCDKCSWTYSSRDEEELARKKKEHLANVHRALPRGRSR